MAVAAPPQTKALDESKIEFIEQNFTNNFKFRLMIMRILPMGYLSGMRIKSLTKDSCEVGLRYKWLVKNPFKSTFWAVMGMAGEMASGALLMMYTYGQKPSIATILVSMSATFHKKGVGKMRYVCDSGAEMRRTVERAYETGEGQTIDCPVQAYNEAGELIAEFTFQWSMKVRKKKQ